MGERACAEKRHTGSALQVEAMQRSVMRCCAASAGMGCSRSSAARMRCRCPTAMWRRANSRGRTRPCIHPATGRRLRDVRNYVDRRRTKRTHPVGGRRVGSAGAGKTQRGRHHLRVSVHQRRRERFTHWPLLLRMHLSLQRGNGFTLKLQGARHGTRPVHAAEWRCKLRPPVDRN